jgi:DNA-directed RNA polymerase subunit RPC12/RpoP
MTTSSITYLFLLSVITEAYEPNSITMERKNYYCEYCGKKFPDVRTLTSGTCTYHPDGSNKGRHKLYEGTEKQEYTCKYCGKKFPSIQVMTGGQCVNHPKGTNKGPHAPAL